MGVQREPFVGMIVRNWYAVEIDVLVRVRTLGEVVVVQRADNRHGKREQRNGEEQHPA